MKILKRYFTINSISLGFLSALCASAFLYLRYWGVEWPWVEALLGLLALRFWLTLPAKVLSLSGFLTGIFWFWWIGLSFRYYDLAWMMPLVIVAIGMVYGLLFYLIGLPKPLWLRAIALGVVEFIHPFGFDWFRPALLFTGSVLGDRLWQYWLILFALALFLSFASKKRYLVLLLLLFAIAFPNTPTRSLPFVAEKIELVQTFIPQEKKWDPRYQEAIVALNLHAIDLAIEKGKQAVVLPESAFPLYLNRHIDLVKGLLEKSEKITILTGALYTDGRKPYNSTYLFQKGHLRIMHKVVLVPFGEANPLPRWLGHWVNDLFFDGASDYITAAQPSDFAMLGHTWRNAICYEATSDRLYADDPRWMVAISNNAWFSPSPEATLQRRLMLLQHHRHGTVIFHATNGPGSGIVGES